MTRIRARFRPALFLLLAIVSSFAACRRETAPAPSQDTRSSPADSETATQPSLAELVPYGNEPWPGIITAGQPSKEALEALRDQGLRTVINLRVPTERGTREEPSWAEDLGLTYVSIPIEGAQGINLQNATALDRALETAERPVLVHCGSSNRVGALLGLRAHELEGLSPEEALEVGRSAGVTKLEERLLELLQ